MSERNHNPRQPDGAPPWGPERTELLLERFIDGDLEGQELAWIERRLQDDPALRAELALQEQIDQALRRTHRVEGIAMPAIPIDALRGLEESVAVDGEPVHRVIPWRRWGVLVAAAIIVLTFAGLFRAYWDARVPDFKLVEPVAMYDRLVRTGFRPAVVCRTEPEFARLVKEKLGTALIAAGSPGVEVLGWGYKDDYDGSPISPKTMMLLARVDGREVLVLLDSAGRDRELRAPAGSGMHLHRRVIGPLVTYEVSPFDAPRVLPVLREP